MNDIENKKRLVSFSLDGSDLLEVRKNIKEGWAIVHLSSKGNKQFIAILERDFIRYEAGDAPIVYIPPRKKVNWRK
jgi:hypothetical protein